MLFWCGKCKEYSVRREIKKRKRDGIVCVYEYCINKGCGYSALLRTKVNLSPSQGR